MLDGFINGARIRDQAREIDYDNGRRLVKLESLLKEKKKEEAKERALAASASNGANSLATPPMLPSPASMTSSASSTPAGKRADEAPTPAPKEAERPSVNEVPDKNVFVDMINRVLDIKKGVFADKVVKFVAAYVKFLNEKGVSLHSFYLGSI